MCIISIDIPEAVRQSARMDTAATADYVRQIVAVAYFTQLHQPIEACASIAQMGVGDFRLVLNSSGIDDHAIWLLSDLEQGHRSGEEKGWHSTDEVIARRIRKRAEMEHLYQPISEEQFRQELLNAQAEYQRGDYMDALAFCEEMERL